MFAAPPNDSLRDTELRQRQIRANAQQVSDAITQLLADFDRNGLSVGEDVKILHAIRSVLGSLTDKEMEQIITLLQAARTAADPATVQKNSLAAFNSQKQVLARLRHLIIQHQRQQALQELARLARELAARQDTSLHECITLAQATQSKTAATFDETQRAALDTHRSEQKAIQTEGSHVLAAIDNLTGATSDERPKLAAQHAKSVALDFILSSAVADLDAGRLLSAAGNQKNIRDHFRSIARILATPHDDASRLRQSARDLDVAIQKEREILDATKAASTQPNELADKQAENVDRVDQIHKAVQNLSPAADAHVQNAMLPMQEARSALVAKQISAAAAAEQTALDALQKARAELEQQLGKAQRDAAKSSNPREALKESQQKLADLGQQQEQLKKESTDKPDKKQADKQAALQKQTQDLQKQTAPQSPKAADALANAAQQMQKAAEAMQKQQPAMDAQQAAEAALKEAAAAMKDDAAKLDKAADELKSVEAVAATLAALIQRQQKLELATGKLLVKPDIKPTATEMAPNQQQLTTDTESLRNNLPTDARAAAAPLTTARQNMTAASGWLQSAKADAAHPQQEQALQNLYKAKNALEQKRDELAEQLGQPPSNTPEIDKAMKDLAKAQQDTADAQQLLDQAGAAQLQQVQERQQQLADALKQNPATQDPLTPAAAAQRAAQQAAQQLSKGNIPAAIQAMQKAEQELQKADQQPMPAQPEQNAQQPGQQQNQQSTQQGQPEQQQAQSGQQGQPQQSGQQAQSGQPQQSMQPFAQQQQRLEQAAQQIAQAQQNQNAQAAMQEAAQALQDAANAVGALATNPGTLPGAVAEPLQNAQMSLANATAQANGSTPSNAGAAAVQAAAAQNAMAQAQAALAAAAAGMMPQSEGKGQEQGQTPGQGQGQGQGQAQAQGQGKDGEGNWNGKAQNGGLAAVKGSGGQFIGLPQRDRTAIKQSQSEKYPQEYGPLIEQYMKNLADQTSGAK